MPDAAGSLPVDQVQRPLCAATLDPSCANTQPWRSVAVTGERLPAIRQALSEGKKWATRAPLIVVMATKPSLDMRLEAGWRLRLLRLGHGGSISHHSRKTGRRRPFKRGPKIARARPASAQGLGTGRICRLMGNGVGDALTNMAGK